MGFQEVYRALGDRTRRDILRLLRDEDMTAGDIAKHFDTSWPSVSRHLSILAAAGLIESDREGSNIRYRPTTSVLEDIATELADLARPRRTQPDKEEVPR